MKTSNKLLLGFYLLALVSWCAFLVWAISSAGGQGV